jgi:ribosomal protein L11 methylase PrmA
MLRRISVLLLTAATAAVLAQNHQPKHEPDVPFVPTPQEVVDEMLKLGNVHKGDVLYDLGCGDGRIVISAAQQYGVEAYGVDIDPQRIEESKENAAKAGVTDKVKFIEGDLFDTDIGKASVVTLYLLHSVNLKLRPKLMKELKPGSRVVSNTFNMDDWEPVKKIDVNGRILYLWVIPEKK